MTAMIRLVRMGRTWLVPRCAVEWRGDTSFEGSAGPLSDDGLGAAISSSVSS
jgi:hypothetical protein